MRVKLKGLHKVTARLAGGKTATYWYAWRGGPRLPGQPGQPDFMAAWTEATSAGPRLYGDTLGGLLDRFQDSRDFPAAERTASDYRRHLDTIRAEFAPMTLAQIEAHGMIWSLTDAGRSALKGKP